MQQNVINCIKVVGGTLKCPSCNGSIIKYGKTKSNIQRYKCKQCCKTFSDNYINCAYYLHINSWIIQLVKEGCGIRSIARLLNISTTTVLKRIMSISKNISKPIISLGKEYEADELCTYYEKKTKLLWIAYALQWDTKQVACFTVGNRTHNTLEKITSTLILSEAKAIYTDNLSLYKYLVPSQIHKPKAYSINHIERKNLSLRTHLKRLSRRTICYSKSKSMLESCLRIYFWG